MRIIVCAVITIALLGCATSTREGVEEYSTSEGVAAYEAGDYETAIAALRPLAEQGLASAQYNLGVIYEHTHGQDFAESLKWYRLAAKQGLGVAQNALGRFYARGEAVQQDYIRAHALFDIAASNGHKPAGDSRDAVGRLLDPVAVSQAQALSRFWSRDPSLIE